MDNNNEQKLDILLEHAIHTNERLDKIDDNLSEHIRRSKAAEKRLDYIEDEIKPMLQHFQGFKWAISALIALSALTKLLDFFKH